jgi:hypothetical protein
MRILFIINSAIVYVNYYRDDYTLLHLKNEYTIFYKNMIKIIFWYMSCTFISEQILLIKAKRKTMGEFMLKILLGIAIVSGSITSFAEDDMMDNSTESKVTGTFPELKTTEEDQRRWNMGVTTGVNSPKGDISATTEYGIIAGFRPVPMVGLALDAGTSRLDDANRKQRTTALVEATYNFGGDVPVINSAYVGVGGGPIIYDSKVKWGYAPLVGFDIPLNRKSHDFISLGLNAKYLITPAGTTPDTFSAAAAMKYWF